MPGQLADPTENLAERQARDSAFDAVVVGAGIGGLTAGALPARTGQEGAGHDELADRMLALAEGVLPGLREHLTFVEESSPVTGPRSRLDRMGPIYGWAVSPGQSGVRRLPQKTPLGGLLLAGHWTQPGHGISFVVASGVAAARLALGRSTSAPVLPLAL